MRTPPYLFIALLLLVSITCQGQVLNDLSDTIVYLPSNFFSKINKRYSSIEYILSKSTAKYLTRMQRHDRKLRRLLHQDNITKRDNSDSFYFSFRRKLAEKNNEINGLTKEIDLLDYDGYIDTLTTALEFCKKTKGETYDIILCSESLNRLKCAMNEFELIKTFILDRKKQLKDLIAEYTDLPVSIKNEYAKLNQTFYYYRAQMYEYRCVLKDPAMFERKTLALLNKLPAFQAFMRENSQLASLFRLPENYTTKSRIAGLQTRASVQNAIQQRITSGGHDAGAMAQVNLEDARSKLNAVKAKLIDAIPGSSSDDTYIPDFKPNKQKTKSFLGRVEFGFNVQFERKNSLLPTTSDIALILGYKFNDNGVTGIGLTYKMGWGSLPNLRVYGQGYGLRSYLDWKLSSFSSSNFRMLGKLSLSGGFEMNYNSDFRKIQGFKDYKLWKPSALLGICKTVGKISAPFNSKRKGTASMQVLYDFLARQQIPFASPILFRFGYKF